MPTQTIFPAVRYADADAALRFLADAFGATEQAVYRDDAGAIRHGQLLIEGSMIFIGQIREDGHHAGPQHAAASNQSLYVLVADPDAHHARAVAAGATITRELTDESYGSREYSAEDPEGNGWSFGTYDPFAG
jgi:uncharacterized glyoxalase superfamily protein PhnB